MPKRSLTFLLFLELASREFPLELCVITIPRWYHESNAWQMNEISSWFLYLKHVQQQIDFPRDKSK